MKALIVVLVALVLLVLLRRSSTAVVATGTTYPEALQDTGGIPIDVRPDDRGPTADYPVATASGTEFIGQGSAVAICDNQRVTITARPGDQHVDSHHLFVTTTITADNLWDVWNFADEGDWILRDGKVYILTAEKGPYIHTAQSFSPFKTQEERLKDVPGFLKGGFLTPF